jgi:hypothetical protein
MNAELKEFVRHALEMKADRGDIARVLTEAGWPAAEIAAALGAFAEIDFVTPPPRPKPFLSARETFFYLLMFGALYRVLWDIGSLAFDYIDKVVPPLFRGRGTSRTISAGASPRSSSSSRSLATSSG